MATILFASARFISRPTLLSSSAPSASRPIEQYHRELTGRVGDVLGNVTVVQSFVRLEAEAQALAT